MAQSVFDVGDPITSRLKLGVTPDGTTTATPVVRRPDGTVITGVAVGPFVADEKTAQFFATDTGAAGAATGEADGDWLVVWTVTGTGASVTAKVYPVRALPDTATRPVWAPFLSTVADYVPYLSLDTSIPGAQTYLGTFTGNTTPTDEQAQRHIDRVSRPIAERWADLPAGLYESATTYVALRSAANILRAFGRTDAERAAAADLAAQADTAWVSLSTAADDTTTSPAGEAQVPVYAFPDPVIWGDTYL